MLRNISLLGTKLQTTEQKLIKGGGFEPVTCTEIFTECDACHPNDYNHFQQCMTDLGCGGNSEFPSR